MNQRSGGKADDGPLRSYSRKQLTGLILGLVLFIAILAAPPLEGLPERGKSMAAVAVLMACWWIAEAIAIAATAFLPLVLFPTLGILPTSETAANYGNQLVFLFLGGFLIAAAMVKWRLHRRIALRTILLFGSSPNGIIFGFMVAAAFLSMWISNTATAMMMVPIAMAVVSRMSETAEYTGKHTPGINVENLVRQNFGLALMLGIAYGASIGGIGTLIGTPPNGVFIGLTEKLYRGEAPAISFSSWLMMALPLVIVMLPLAWLIVTRVSPKVRLDRFTFGLGGKKVIQQELKSLGPMTAGELKTAVVFASAALLWLTRKPIDFGFVEMPGWSNIFSNPGFFTDATVAIAMGLLLFILPADTSSFRFSAPRRENFVLDWGTARENIPWGVLFLFGGGFALADGFAGSGLSSYLGTHLHVLGGLPVILTVAGICFFMTFLTEMTSNTATTTLVLPILALAALDLGQHPFLLMIPATLSASCAFMLPVATPPNAIVFGSGWVTIPRMSYTGIWLNLLGVVLITFFTLFLAAAMLGIPLDAVPGWAEQLT